MIDPSDAVRKETHNKIDKVFKTLTKDIGNILENIKFNETHLEEETNILEVSTSMESMSQRFTELVTIVNKMKMEVLKKRDFNYSEMEINKKTIIEEVEELKIRLVNLQEVQITVGNLLREFKMKPYYNYALNYK